MTTADNEIRVGTKMVRIEEPTGWKFLEATEIIAEMTQEVPDLLKANEEYVTSRREADAITITYEEARVRYPELVAMAEPDAWWAERGGSIRVLGEPPSDAEQQLMMFGHVFAKAKEKAVRLVAVLSAPDGELKKADESSGIDEYLKGWERELLHGTKVSQLAHILALSLTAMRDEFAADGEAAAAVGEIRQFFRGTQTQPPPSPSPSVPPTPQEAPAANSPPESSDESTRPTSSTGSPTPTGGTEPTPSTDPDGASSGTSQTASVPESVTASTPA